MILSFGLGVLGTARWTIAIFPAFWIVTGLLVVPEVIPEERTQIMLFMGLWAALALLAWLVGRGVRIVATRTGVPEVVGAYATRVQPPAAPSLEDRLRGGVPPSGPPAPRPRASPGSLLRATVSS